MQKNLKAEQGEGKKAQKGGEIPGQTEGEQQTKKKKDRDKPKKG